MQTRAAWQKTQVTFNHGAQIFCQLDIFGRCEYMFFTLGNMFKFIGHNQFLEICAATKEIVLFHDHGFVLLRFAGDLTELFLYGLYCDVMVDWKYKRYSG